MNKIVFISILLAANFVLAQDDPVSETATEAQKETTTGAAAEASESNTIGAANINLRTTVTGNQEQPRVMYILPWQSPLSADLEMEMASSQQEAVFGHIERDELQRQLESAGEFDTAAE